MSFQYSHYVSVAMLAVALLHPATSGMAHEGEDHGQQTPEIRTNNGLSLSGHGDTFEVVLKSPIASPGTEVPLTAYVVEFANNRPVPDAKITANLSTGNDSKEIQFEETSATLPGSYVARVKMDDESTHSLLFDVTQADRNDLIPVDGLKSGQPDNTSSIATRTMAPRTLVQSGFLWGGGLLLIVAVVSAFFIIRNEHRPSNKGQES